MKKFQTLKGKLKTKFEQDFENKKSIMLDEIRDIKNSIYRQKCKDKLKMGKINLYNKAIQDKEKAQLDKASKLEKTLYVMEAAELGTNTHASGQNFFNSGPTNFTSKANYNNGLSTSKTLSLFSPKKEEIVYHEEFNPILNVNNLNNKVTNTIKSFLSPHSQNGIVEVNRSSSNLNDINKRIKEYTSLSVIPINSNKKPDISLILKDEEIRATTNLVDDLKALKTVHMQNIKNFGKTGPLLEGKPEIISGRSNIKNKEDLGLLSPVSSISPDLKSTSRSLEKLDSKKKLFIISKPNDIFRPKKALESESLVVIGEHPKLMREYGNYLIKKIEAENKYKLLFEGNIKKIKAHLISMFKNNKETEHGLITYLFDMWKKIEISYEIRFNLCKKMVAM